MRTTNPVGDVVKRDQGEDVWSMRVAHRGNDQPIRAVTQVTRVLAGAAQTRQDRNATGPHASDHLAPTRAKSRDLRRQPSRRTPGLATARRRD
jgi:hypothetical protein